MYNLTLAFSVKGPSIKSHESHIYVELNSKHKAQNWEKKKLSTCSALLILFKYLAVNGNTLFHLDFMNKILRG